MKIYTAVAIALSLAAISTAVASSLGISTSLQNVLFNLERKPIYTYPTDLTRDIVPKAIHSHNDYWRPIPFYTALSHGCTSIEADVWLHNSTLYVGHSPSSLTPLRTLTALYIDPLLALLKHQNPASPLIPADPPTTQAANGVWDGYPAQTLFLFIDIKTPGAETWPHVLAALQPLRDAGYLSRVENANSTTITYAPVTVIGTGNTPLDLILSPPATTTTTTTTIVPEAVLRDAFYDAPLALLNTTLQDIITPLISPIASTSFLAQIGPAAAAGGSPLLNTSQTALLKAQVAQAHARGIRVRYWELPAWPIGVRNAVWKMLWAEGVDLVNADDLKGAAGLW